MKALKIISALILFSFYCFLSHAGGGGTIKGNIIGPMGSPVPMANVFLTVGGQLRGAVTDLDGKFTIKPITSGSYDLYVTSIGFDTLIITGVRVIDQRITMLKNKALEFRTIRGTVVIGYPIPLIDIDEPGVITFGANDLKDLPNRSNLTSMLATITPGFYQQEPGKPVMVRGSRGGASTYFVDGVKTDDLNSGTPSASVGTIRVYSGGIPAQYGDVVGGIVVVETKSFLSWYKKQ